MRLVLEIVSPSVCETMPSAHFEEALAGYIEPVLRLPPALCPGADEAVRALAARGIALGIVSNTGRTPGIILRKILERYDLLRHFSVDDRIEANDQTGHVEDIQIFCSILRTDDGTKIILPNNAITSGVIKVYKQKVNRDNNL